MKPPEEPLELQCGPMHVDQPDLGPALVLERMGRARRDGDGLPRGQFPPRAADSDVERPGYHRVALLRGGVDVQGRPPEAGRDHIHRLEQLPVRVGCPVTARGKQPRRIPVTAAPRPPY